MGDVPAEIEAAHAAFYRAFETLDLEQMTAVWVHAEHATCVHPGWPLLSGWSAVRDSWDAIFANTEEMRFTLSDVRAVAVGDDLAVLTCTENILTSADGRLTVSSVLATNVLERTPAGWRIAHHHASPILAARD